MSCQASTGHIDIVGRVIQARRAAPYANRDITPIITYRSMGSSISSQHRFKCAPPSHHKVIPDSVSTSELLLSDGSWTSHPRTSSSNIASQKRITRILGFRHVGRGKRPIFSEVPMPTPTKITYLKDAYLTPNGSRGEVSRRIFSSWNRIISSSPAPSTGWLMLVTLYTEDY